MTKAQASNTARRRRINHALLVLVPLAVFTGLFSNTIGADWWLDPASIGGSIRRPSTAA
jgi:hypothetical protein